MKILLWLLIVLAVVAWIYRSKKPLKAPAPHDRASPSGAAEPMRRCAHCETYIPASEALSGPSGTAFCSEEHRRLGAVRR